MQERNNCMIRRIPPESRLELCEIWYQANLSFAPGVRLIARGSGTCETMSPDWLRLFNPDYLGAVIEIGWNDTRRNSDETKLSWREGHDHALPT